MKFNKPKCKILLLDLGNLKHECRLNREVIESCPGEKDFEVFVGKELNTTQKFAAQKANCTLGSVKRRMASRLREVILLLCSALVRPHLKHCVQLWGPKHKKDIYLLKIDQRDPKLITAGASRASLLWRQLERAGALQPREEKALGTPYSTPLLPKGDLQGGWRGTFHKDM
ncbi:hypothetical protein HGM15179_005397 [Zosterops borbonicus]|uniref:Uncharacterized protein n=1 Tax=Zosterops borbonicus TaxID=364589 RepID=A0A8K1GPG7_9PASS|nr:hypothetical protein HGM15179_005397 [Zosterops borbonicus]